MKGFLLHCLIVYYDIEHWILRLVKPTLKSDALILRTDNIGDFIVNGKFPVRNSYLPHIPKRLQKIVEKCLSSQHDDGGFIGNTDTLWNVKFLEFFPK